MSVRAGYDRSWKNFTARVGEQPLMDMDESAELYDLIENYVFSGVLLLFRHTTFFVAKVHEAVVVITASLDGNRTLHSKKVKAGPGAAKGRWRTHDLFVEPALELAYLVTQGKATPEELTVRLFRLGLTRSIVMCLINDARDELRKYEQACLRLIANPADAEALAALESVRQSLGVTDEDALYLLRNLDVWMNATYDICREFARRHTRQIVKVAGEVQHNPALRPDAAQDATVGILRAIRDFRKPFARLNFFARWGTTAAKAGARRGSNTIVVGANMISDFQALARHSWAPVMCARVELFSRGQLAGRGDFLVQNYEDLPAALREYMPKTATLQRRTVGGDKRKPKLGPWTWGDCILQSGEPLATQVALVRHATRYNKTRSKVIGRWPPRYRKALEALAKKLDKVPAEQLRAAAGETFSKFQKHCRNVTPVPTAKVRYEAVDINPSAVARMRLADGTVFAPENAASIIRCACQHMQDTETQSRLENVDQITCSFSVEARPNDLGLLAERVSYTERRVQRTLRAIRAAHTFSLDRVVSEEEGAVSVVATLSEDSQELADREYWEGFVSTTTDALDCLTDDERLTVCLVYGFGKQLGPNNPCKRRMQLEKVRQQLAFKENQ